MDRSITHWIDDLKQGDAATLRAIWGCYPPERQRYATKRIFVCLRRSHRPPRKRNKHGGFTVSSN
jgi:hypothetical protein